jgi:hypothetical protein
MNRRFVYGMVLAASIFLSLGGRVYAQSYLGIVTQASNLRSGPGTEYEVVSVLAEGTILFVDSADSQNNFYKVIDIDNGAEGWISKSLVKLGNELPEIARGKMFTPSGKTLNVNSEVLVRNTTSLVLSLVLNGNRRYTFEPGAETTLELEAGAYRFRAVAPGVIPAAGIQDFDGYKAYTWTFSIRSLF